MSRDKPGPPWRKTIPNLVLHVHDTLRGLVESQHWLLDLPGVYLPAVLLVVAAIHSARHRETAK